MLSILLSNVYTEHRIAQKFDREKLQRMDLPQNFDELTVGFKGETLREEVGRKNFNKSLAIHQICQSFPPSNFCAIW